MSDLPTSTPTLLHNPTTQTLSLTPHPVPLLPTPNTQAHLLKIHAAALTKNELTWPEPLAATPCPIPGYEISATVLCAPPTSPFQPGAQVIARTDFSRPGNARRFGVAMTEELGMKPRNLSWVEAAVVPLSALTAWQALFVHAALGLPGQDAKEQQSGAPRVLVTAAAGGVGIFAVQLARLAGAYVVGTCGAANVDFIQQLGANEVLDYRDTSLAEWVKADRERAFDVVIDCVGGKTLEDAWLSVRTGGIVISVAEPAEGKRPRDGVAGEVRSKWFIVGADGGQLKRVTELIEQERLRVVFDSSFRLEEYERAFEKVQSGHARGKVVLDLGGP